MKPITNKQICNLVIIFIFAISILFPISRTQTSSADSFPKTYTIKFYSNDGSGLFHKMKKLENVGEFIPEMTILHEGFEFVGWATNKNATYPEISKAVREIQSNVNENRVYYAVWHTIGAAKPVLYEKPARPIKATNKSIKKGKRVTIKAKNLGQGKCSFKYKSSKNKILKINSKGVGKALKKGKVTVTITSPEDGLYKKTVKRISVTVK